MYSGISFYILIKKINKWIYTFLLYIVSMLRSLSLDFFYLG